MATGNQVINYARQFLGEGSARFSDWYYGSQKYRAWAWCNVFVSYVLQHCGVNFQKTAYVPAAESWMDAHYKWVKMSEAQPGDVIIFCWSGEGNNTGRGSRDHIGFLIANNGNGTFTTIEGNTSGSRVAIRTRSAKNIRKIFRPTYDGASAPSTSAPTSTPAPQVSNKGLGLYTVTAPLNCRSGAGTGFPVIRTYPAGTPIRVLKIENNFGYSSGAGGWLCMDFLRPQSGAASVPAASSSGRALGMYHVNAAGGLNVRSGPGTGYRRVNFLKNGTPLRILKVSGDWGYSKGAGGWVHLGYCRRG